MLSILGGSLWDCSVAICIDGIARSGREEWTAFQCTVIWPSSHYSRWPSLCVCLEMWHTELLGNIPLYTLLPIIFPIFLPEVVLPLALSLSWRLEKDTKRCFFVHCKWCLFIMQSACWEGSTWCGHRVASSTSVCICHLCTQQQQHPGRASCLGLGLLILWIPASLWYRVSARTLSFAHLSSGASCPGSD